MVLLILSLLALALAPLLHRLARKARSALQVLDGVIVVAIGGIVLLHIIPHVVQDEGWIGFVVALAGLIGPGMTERAMSRLAKPAHVLAAVLAVLAVSAHTFMDGAALGATASAPSNELKLTFALAVILHRLPEGLMIWWLVRPWFGGLAAAGLLGIVGVSTTAGFLGGEVLLAGVASRWLNLLQALVAGSLLHVVNHRPLPVSEDHGGQRRGWSGVGGLIGIGLLVAISSLHGHAHEEDLPVQAFWGLVTQCAPALVIAYVLSSLIHAVLPSQGGAWMRHGSRTFQWLRGALLGMPLPICSCGAIPIYRSLIKQGVPVAAAAAFMVAAPAIGVDAALVSLPLLGIPSTICRLVAALLLAFLVAVVMSRLVSPTQIAPSAHQVAHRGNASSRLVAGFKFGLGDVVDETGPWIVFGLAIAAVTDRLVPQAWITGMPSGLDVPIMALVGMPVYVCAAGATPLMAVLIVKGLSPGAAIAFLLTGPATSATTFSMLARLHGTRAAVGFGAAVALVSIGLGYAVNSVVPPCTTLVLDGRANGLLSYVFALVLAAIFLVSLLRQGPRGFIGQLASIWPHRHEHDEQCGECCEHEHGQHDPCISRERHAHDDTGHRDDDCACCD